VAGSRSPGDRQQHRRGLQRLEAVPRVRHDQQDLHCYCDHIDRYLIPSIGRVTLADLTGRRLQACFNLIARQRIKKGTLIAAATVDRVRATLRSALNAAVREGHPQR